MRVLIADDDADVREVLVESFRDAGFDVLQAANGLEALLCVKRDRPDAVVLDLMMPRLNGLEVLSTLKADPALARTRVLVVTAQPASEVEAREHGADGVIVKPFAPEDLAELAVRLVG